MNAFNRTRNKNNTNNNSANLRYFQNFKRISNSSFRLLALLVFFLFNSLALYSQDRNIYKYTVGDFEFLYYGKGYSYLVPHTARGFINSFDFHKDLFDYSVDRKIPVFIHDFADFGNGGAVAIPFNFVTLGINPFDNVYENVPANERMQWLASHELTHIVMCDKAGASENFFRTLFFGKPMNDNTNPLSMIYSYLASARWYSPRWYHEGIAIFMETFMNGGAGRMLGGYDEMVFRTMVLDSSYFYEPIGLETEGSTIDFMVGANAYLYGARFVAYLASQHGKDKLLDFYTRSDSSRGFFASQFRNVYGTSLLDEWRKWIEFEKQYQIDNLEIINEHPTNSHRVITETVLGSVSRQFYSEKRNSIIAAVNYPGNLANIAEINIETGKMREIAPVKSPRLLFVTSLAYNDEDGIIFTTENNSHFRDLAIIDIESGKYIKRLKFTRLGDLVFNKADKSLWGIRNYNGRSIVSRMLPPYDKVEELITVPFGYNLFDLDISPDGKYLSGTYSDPNGRQKVVLYAINDILQGKMDYTEIYEFEDNSASNFTFSRDGKSFYGTSYITGVSNIFKIDIESKEPDILTNTERGYFRPVEISADSLIAFSYNARGLSPVALENKQANANAINYLGMEVISRNPELRRWNLPPLSSVNLDSIGVSEVRYRSIPNTRLAYLIPIVEGYKDFPSYGFKARFFDKLFINGLDLTLSYSPNSYIPEDERLHFNMKYHYFLWEFFASWNRADFYDLFGPTKRSREGGMLGMKYNGILLPNRSPEKLNYTVSGAYFFDLKTLPLYQNVRSNVSQLFMADLSINYSELRRSLGAVEPERGFEYKLTLHNDYAGNANFLKAYGNANFGWLLPIRNSSVWMRLFAGKSFGDDASPFNYFYFGGFGNNYLDNNSVQRYREMYSMPGAEINSIAANEFAKATFEWNLPPLRLRKFGFLPAYITYSRLSLFSSALVNDFSRINDGAVVASLGAQVDFELSLFYLLKTHLSFGYAQAYNKWSKPSNEFMISLKF